MAELKTKKSTKRALLNDNLVEFFGLNHTPKYGKGHCKFGLTRLLYVSVPCFQIQPVYFTFPYRVFQIQPVYFTFPYNLLKSNPHSVLFPYLLNNKDFKYFNTITNKFRIHQVSLTQTLQPSSWKPKKP